MNWRQRLRPFAFFVVGGALNTAFSYCIYLLLEPFIGYSIAYFSAFVIGIVFSYFFTSIIVFKRKLNLRSFFAFPLVYLLQYVFGSLILEVLVRRFGVDKLYAPLVVAALMLPITFVLSKFILKITARKVNGE